MMKMVFAIELMAMAGMAIAFKKNRTLAEMILWASILITANYYAWSM